MVRDDSYNQDKFLDVTAEAAPNGSHNSADEANASARVDMEVMRNIGKPAPCIQKIATILRYSAIIGKKLKAQCGTIEAWR